MQNPGKLRRMPNRTGFRERLGHDASVSRDQQNNLFFFILHFFYHFIYQARFLFRLINPNFHFFLTNALEKEKQLILRREKKMLDRILRI